VVSRLADDRVLQFNSDSSMQKCPDPKKKILSLRAAVAWREKMKKKGLKLAFTNGCFDILHRGHVEYLVKARNHADALVVALNSDKSVKTLKDPSRPIIKEADRAYTLAAMSCVDAVVVFTQRRCTKIIKALQPDVYVKGGDYNIANMDKDEKNALLGCGAKISFVKFIKGLSSTSIIEKLRGRYARPKMQDNK